MLINLTTRNAFKVIDHTKAIICGKGWGPRFGDAEFQAFEPFNGNDNCWSYVNNAGYHITMDSESKSNLTNLKCKITLGDYFSSFTISELEVWEIILEK